MNKPARVDAPPFLKGKTEIIERCLICINTSAIRSQNRNLLRREIQNLSKLAFALPDLLFRLLALGDIDYGAHELNKIAGWAENRVPYCVDISDFATGMNDSVVHLKLCPFAPCSL